MKKIAYFLWACCIAGCTGNGNSEKTEGDTLAYTYVPSPIHDSEKIPVTDTTKFEGTYSGLLPCASCEGIETTLTLYDDHSFLMKEVYKDEQPDTFVNKGKYEVKSNTLYLKMDGAGVERPVMYAVRPNSLTQLDMNGKEITGALAGHYVLMKN
ncbi:copper resistance protein NlpE [Niabella drilacis]|uniref:NlpE N-terminal domain-containing protein n=1 Tax=Niabella drilacis (strain DSM 25811 / CCM 8410 / CCUG 62505 / LMG 26954 / E90) TaxID=1285928 RepID=A0A1G6IBP2_NIADE|nr:copper resistance protein NlpE [Niabella drilacis]SDC03901.1 NlpE N-terminal domain-containing protein [Niabella drilacis]